jgi:vancomycin resistance protein YoaR
MKHLLKISLPIASLFFILSTHQAQAASDLVLHLTDTPTYVQNYLSTLPGETVFKQDITIPASVVASLQNSQGGLAQPAFFQNNSGSLDGFIKDSFAHDAATPAKPSPELANFLLTNVAPALKETHAEDATWEEKDGRVINFNPGQVGTSYSLLHILYDVEKAIKNNQTELTISPVSVSPSHSLADSNSYGITTLIARGVSDFTGSSKNRTTNVRVGTSKYKGIIIPAGKIFSFNSMLGDIDAKNGWAPEIVIKGKDLVPEFGGGICQVSTTFFRAALNAGFEIDERHNHAFAVNHYAPQGTDATIYTGSTDFKFTNNSNTSVMIWPYMVGTHLVFDIYGQPDGRTIQVDQPVRYDIVGNGAFKTSLKRTVTLTSGKVINDNIKSNYRPASEFTSTTTAVEPPKPQTPPPTPAEPTAPQPTTPDPTLPTAPTT